MPVMLYTIRARDEAQADFANTPDMITLLAQRR
jgi:hypothetical protein